MKKILLSALVSLSLVSITWAKNSNYECPSISAIQQIGLDTIDQNSNGNYTVSKRNVYDTTHVWIFTVRNIIASSSSDAFAKATSTLSTLSGNPQRIYKNGFMDCQYINGNVYITDAYTKYIG